MATIYDVAQLAGVSHTAVSAVINDKPIRMKDTTRQRILEAAKSLGYQANRAAQQLSTGKYNSIALCFSGRGERIFLSQTTNQLAGGIVNGASENGFYLLFAPTRFAYTFEESIEKLPSQGVDGAVVIGPLSLAGNGLSVINRCSLPLVCVDSHPGLTAASTVDTDCFTGIKRGVEHLVKHGHRRMAYITPPPDYQCLVERLRGFYQGVKDAGLSLADQVTHVVPLEDVPEVLRQSLAADGAPTALISAEEETTAVILDEAARTGLRVPDDISILSYDDVTGHPLAESINVIRNDFFAMGEAAVDLLVKLIRRECSGPVSLRLPPEFVVRTP